MGVPSTPGAKLVHIHTSMQLGTLFRQDFNKRQSLSVVKRFRDKQETEIGGLQ